MKRIFAVLLAALFVVSMLAGCSKSGPEGKYVVKSMGGVPVDEYFDSMIAEYGEGMTKESLLNELGIKIRQNPHCNFGRGRAPDRNMESGRGPDRIYGW